MASATGCPASRGRARRSSRRPARPRRRAPPDSGPGPCAPPPASDPGRYGPDSRRGRQRRGAAVAWRSPSPGHDGDVEADERAHIAEAMATGPDDLDRLPVAGERQRHLAHARVEVARQRRRRKAEPPCRQTPWPPPGHHIAIEPTIGACRRLGNGAGMAAMDCPHYVSAARRGGGFRDLARMGESGGLATNGTQAEALVTFEGCRAQPAIVEAQDLAWAHFEEQFAVIGTSQGILDDALGLLRRDFSPCSKKTD